MYVWFACLSLTLVFFTGAEDSHIRSEKNDSDCYDNNDCITECNDFCGCERAYFYNATLNECVYDLNYANNLTVEKYSTLEKVSADAERVFKSLLTSVLIIAFFLSVAVISGCFYCFRVEYTDHKLRHEVMELEKRVGRKGNKISLKQRLDPIAESCNVLIEDAGIMVM